MQLEYFQLIDRILDLDTEAKTITVEAQVPTASTIFEGHFPGYPLMPGVLLIELMAQTSGWLLLGLDEIRTHAVSGRGQGSQDARLRLSRRELLDDRGQRAFTKAPAMP